MMRQIFVCTFLCVGVFSAACSISKSSPVSPSSPVPTESTPSSGGGQTLGDGCTSSDPLAIVTCERNKYDHMTADQENAFIRATAAAFAANHIPGGPFGILRKAGGSNCNGYACDILCAGQGQSQLQWDVLADGDPWPNGGAQIPEWGSPAGYPNIRVDSCEVQ